MPKRYKSSDSALVFQRGFDIWGGLRAVESYTNDHPRVMGEPRLWVTDSAGEENSNSVDAAFMSWNREREPLKQIVFFHGGSEGTNVRVSARNLEHPVTPGRWFSPAATVSVESEDAADAKGTADEVAKWLARGANPQRLATPPLPSRWQRFRSSPWAVQIGGGLVVAGVVAVVGWIISRL